MKAPQWELKCWGRVMHVFSSPEVAMSYLEVEKGWQCSRHMHEERANGFMVLSGRIEIDIWSGLPVGPPTVISLPSREFGNS